MPLGKGFKRLKRISFSLILVTLLVTLVCSVPVGAASLEGMAAQADAIVITTPLSKVSYWDGKIIRTRATLQVEQVISGALRGDRVTIVYDGGVVGKIGLKVSHGVRLPVGQKNLVFLKNMGQDFTVVNQSEGVFYILQGKEGEVVLPSEEMDDTRGVTVKSALGPSAMEKGIPLKEFLSILRTFNH